MHIQHRARGFVLLGKQDVSVELGIKVYLCALIRCFLPAAPPHLLILLNKKIKTVSKELQVYPFLSENPLKLHPLLSECPLQPHPLLSENPLQLHPRLPLLSENPLQPHPLLPILSEHFTECRQGKGNYRLLESREDATFSIKI